MDDILNEIKPDLPQKAASYGWLIVGIIVLVGILVIYFTMIRGGGSEKKVEPMIDQKPEPLTEEIKKDAKKIAAEFAEEEPEPEPKKKEEETEPVEN